MLRYAMSFRRGIVARGAILKNEFLEIVHAAAHRIAPPMNVAWHSRCVNMLHPRCYLRSPSWIMHLTRPRYLRINPRPASVAAAAAQRGAAAASTLGILPTRYTLLQNDLSHGVRPAFHIISVKVPWNIASGPRKKATSPLFQRRHFFAPRSAPRADRSGTTRDPPSDPMRKRTRPLRARGRVNICAMVNRAI